MNNWLIYPLTIADQQQHIEQSEHLLRMLQPGDPGTLYWSLAQPAGLVLGFSQKEHIINPDALIAGSMPIYHRRAGGTAVLVGPTLLSLDVVLPADHPLHLPDLVESYRWFGEAWVAALAQLGAQTRTVPPEEAHAQRTLRKQSATRDYEILMNRACYGSLSPYEVVSGQRKVVGFDMIRRRAGSLLQAGVLLQWDTQVLAQLLGHTQQEQTLLQTGLLERAVGLDTLLERVITSEEVIKAFERVLIPDERQRLMVESSSTTI
ncbi:lipoyl protein ligase domain-containing protein [Dictyobacter arantiisoli]|uniref:Ligase n=1 Tax=Dictyobacter arantiisoli TaxID=2014874 RepID=A0A5A5T9A2_9CHLR|nr:ligase [Dictyobacter arantiisoli]GCF07845.1 ligase [Dictyobacter arantiisoli]